jgi:hypothetical protein
MQQAPVTQRVVGDEEAEHDGQAHIHDHDAPATRR